MSCIILFGCFLPPQDDDAFERRRQILALSGVVIMSQDARVAEVGWPASDHSGWTRDELRRQREFVEKAPLIIRECVGLYSLHLRRLATFRDSDLRTLGLERMTKLTHLSLDSTCITDDAYPHVALCTALKTLSLRDTRVTSRGAQALSALRQLERLNLADTRVDERIWPTLERLPCLHRLDLSGSPIGSIPQSLPNLRALSVARTGIGDDDLARIGEMTQLENLSLSETSLTDKGLAQLSSLKKMMFLRLAYTQITDDSVEVLAGMPELELLDLAGTGISRQSVEELRAELPRTEIMFNDLLPPSLPD